MYIITSFDIFIIFPFPTVLLFDINKFYDTML